MSEPQEMSVTDNTIALWTKRLGIFTLLLVGATIISDVIIALELYHTRSEAQFLHEQQRAYFGAPQITQVGGSVDKEKKQTAGFFLQWKNIGATRTEWTSGWASIQYFPNGVPNNFDTSRPNMKTSPSKTVVGPNLDLTTSMIGITNQEYKDASTGKGDLVIWGALDYADIVHPERVHHDHICFKLTPSGTMKNSATQQEDTTFQVSPLRAECNITE